jgi:hypothetical protein
VVAEWEVLSRLLAVKYDAGSGALEQMMLERFPIIPVHSLS